MSQEEKDNIVEYYEEYFEEAGPEREAEVIEELGSPRNLGIRLSGESAVKSLNEMEAAKKAERNDAKYTGNTAYGTAAGVNAPSGANGTTGQTASGAEPKTSAASAAGQKKSSGGSVWKTVLIIMALIIGSPLILPAAIVAIVMVFVIIVVVVALGIAAAAVLFAGVAAFFVGVAVIFAGSFAKGLLAIGVAFLIFGFGILGVLAIIGIVKGIQKLILWIGNRKLNQGEISSAAAGGAEAPGAENAYIGSAAKGEAADEENVREEINNER